MSLVTTIKSWLGGAEGSYRGPAIGFSTWGNAFEVPIGDGYQAGLSLARPSDAAAIPAAYAAVMAEAKAVSMCRPLHMRKDSSGRYQQVTTSPLSRILRRPNAYQSWVQFILNAVATMRFHGESFAVIVRDDRFAATALHLLPASSCSPYVDSASGEIFYSIGSSPMVPSGAQYMAPARDVIHLRQYTPVHPLIGVSPVAAAMTAMGTNLALSANQAAFYSQMNRPSGIMTTDSLLTRDQMLQLRTAFDEQSRGMNAGKVPILGNGLKFTPMSISSQDAQVIEAQRMSIEEIARVFSVPLPIIGDLSGATLGNTESVINFWLATSLGSLIELLEASFDNAFNLGIDEHIEFDTAALLRMDFKTRIEGYTKAVQGGIMAPNEIRAYEGLPPVEDGDKLFLQRQMTPIDLLTELAMKELQPPPAPAAPAVPAADAPGEDPEDIADEEDDTEDEADAEISRALTIANIQTKRMQ